MFDRFFNLTRNEQIKLLQEADIADDGRVRLSLSGQRDNLTIGIPGGDCVEITRHGINKKGILPLANKVLYQQVVGIGQRDCVTCGNPDGDKACNSCDDNFANYM